MSGTFSRGDCLSAVQSGRQVRIEEYLGEGGQGEVYKVDWAGKEFALKWYFDHTGTAQQKKMIERLVEEGAPGNSFLWPMDMVSKTGSDSFGYVMPLRPLRFESFIDIVNGRLDPKFSTLMTVGLNLVQAFYGLHSKGLCYRDISFGNGFFDMKTGDVLICDNDNVTANKETSNTVLGTPDFMAPEIVNRRAKPSRETDYFSLSVLLFYLFHIQHPLLGKKVLAIRSWDLPAREKLFGKEPVFIFDPNDKSNAAIDNPKVDPIGEAGKNAMPYWNNVYPTVLKNAFIQSFTEGIRNPDRRLIGSAWKKVLLESRDSIFTCAICGVENFFDPSNPTRKCWACQASIKPKFFLELSDTTLVLSPGTQLLNRHLGNVADAASAKSLGTIVTHPQRADVWGLRNDTQSNWVAYPQGKGMVEVPAGKSVPLVDGTKVTIGNGSCTVRV